eukprot:scaffold9366_cov92-Skeletonema_dohrnii-CCMP3373.AAC.1
MKKRVDDIEHLVVHTLNAVSFFLLKKMANYDGSLEAVYHMVLECRARSWQPSQMSHQVTYDVAATPIRPTNA